MDQAKLKKAFDLVCPAEHAKKLAQKGLISTEDAGKVDWKSTIAALVLETELEAAGVTIAEVSEAVVFFTATEPTVTAEQIGMRAGEPVELGNITRPGYLVMSVGYRMGPAGP